MKSLLIVVCMFSSVSAFAGTYYECIDEDRSDILFIIDFEAKRVSTHSITRNRAIATDKMSEVDREFKNVGESLAKKRGANVTDGTVEIRQAGKRITGHYQGMLTFGDRWDFSCEEQRD